jgi:predicted glycogen debranching enzyme
MREWIIANGLGGYASLTHNLSNTRKYHGLLVASLNPPTQRWVFVTNILDRVEKDGEIIYLHNHKPVFCFDIFPSFTYIFKNFEIKKTIVMEHEKNTTIVKYNVKTKKPIKLYHQPVVNSRHIYDVNSQRYLNFEQDIFKDKVTIKSASSSYVLKISLKDAVYEIHPYWEEYFFEKDRERNDSWIDNNFRTGKFLKKISKNSEYYMGLTIEKDYNILPRRIFTQEKQRRKKLVEQANLPNSFKKFILSTDNFIVKKGDSKSIIAGYHWFGDWGRDTFISLPGIALITKRFNEAKQILSVFSKYSENGLIPNAFMERDSKPVYNNVDSSLWYIDCVFQYLKYTNDIYFLEEIWETITSIIDGYINGTSFDIKMDEDFLINHGPGLTWMDVKIGDFYPTPRFRKAVEIQALWYNALRIMSLFSKKLGKEDLYHSLSESVKESFNNQYDMLYDVIDTHDFSLRPNIIFLVSLDFSMIGKTHQKNIVELVQNELLTVFGLRTLSSNDQNYKDSYLGNYNKDIAYHNGTVWPWLMGPFVKAYVKVNDFDKKHRLYAFKNFLKPLLDIYGKQWDGSIHEIFDAEPIYIPRGCISQAWSVAEIFRTWVEDIENIRPDFEKEYILHEISI